MSLLRIKKAVDCRRCGLRKCRTQVVFGGGSRDQGIMVVGKSPDGEDDRKGKAFVNRAGKRMDRWFKTIGLKRDDDYYATHVVKCRTPDDRDPEPDELQRCNRWLRYELRKIQPWLIVTLGNYPTRVFLNDPAFKIMRGQGRVYPRMLYHLGHPTDDFILIFPILHPLFVLRNQHAEEYVLDQLNWLKTEVLSKAPNMEVA